MSPSCCERRPSNACNAADLRPHATSVGSAVPIPVTTAAAINSPTLFSSPPSLASSVSLSVHSSLESPCNSYHASIAAPLPLRKDASAELCAPSLHSEKSGSNTTFGTPGHGSSKLMARTWSNSSCASYASSCTSSVSMTNAMATLSTSPASRSSGFMDYTLSSSSQQQPQPSQCEELLLSTTMFGVITGVRDGSAAHRRSFTFASSKSSYDRDNASFSGLRTSTLGTHTSRIALRARDAVGQPVFRFIHNADLPVFCRALSRATREVSRCAVRWSPSMSRDGQCAENATAPSSSDPREPRWYWVWCTVRLVDDQIVCVIRRPLQVDDDDDGDACGAKRKAEQRRRRRNTYGGLSGLVLSLFLSDSESEADSEAEDVVSSSPSPALARRTLSGDTCVASETEDGHGDSGKLTTPTITPMARDASGQGTEEESGAAAAISNKSTTNKFARGDARPLSPAALSTAAATATTTISFACATVPTSSDSKRSARLKDKKRTRTSASSTSSSFSRRRHSGASSPPSSLISALANWAGAAIGDAMFGTVSRYTTDLFRRRDDRI
ncbi:hypothetical protein THASP1DRAFT_28644 [Thamnocephalis sphaerospora]|uniref:Uncharacterized protein n=1 Tax=Thamnocephalis sphaerospora TaxID=78915 RepID=A0A4V1IX24_9FUNG|nr:hypothetical protein THASP1DRAFT_28644 [Thamnocephalis sphaerospora]|eukprot:RKP09569.1 hypothetical protein THASP1DRAFT_28644 [Thamnocephalis sphaerospora]